MFGGLAGSGELPERGCAYRRRYGSEWRIYLFDTRAGNGIALLDSGLLLIDIKVRTRSYGRRA